MALAEIRGDSFESEIGSDRPVLVHFWRPDSYACLALERVLEASNTVSPLRIVNIDASENPVLVRRYSVLTLPTCILFRRGGEKARFVGVQSRRWVLWRLAPHVGKVIDLRKEREALAPPTV